MDVELIACTPDPERVIEAAARTCYQSADKMGDGSESSFLPKLIAMGHESPFEHAYATFRLSGVSRAMTHQLVRHRLMAVCQKSQRYVSEEAFEYVLPPALSEEQATQFRADMAQIQAMYRKWRERGLRREDARFVLPNACATEIVISADFREFRHIFDVRCSRHAQWEIREAAFHMLDALLAVAPAVFKDQADALAENRPDHLR